MANRQYLNVRINLGSTRTNIIHWVNWFQNTKNLITEHMKKFNPEQMKPILKKSAKNALLRRNVRVGTHRIEHMLDHMFIDKVRSGDKTTINVGHEYESKNDHEFEWTSARRKFTIMGSELLDIMEYGTRAYKIPRTFSSSTAPVLVWSYGNKKVLHSLKDKIPIQSPARKATFFLRSAIRSLTKYVDKNFESLRKAVKKQK